jgi:hypothetical protein
MELSAAGIDQTSPSDLKITLFRSLFRGPEDVYARRFESRNTGKSGYTVACANDWVRGICEEPRIRFIDDVCPKYAYQNDAGNITSLPGAPQKFIAANDYRRIY